MTVIETSKMVYVIICFFLSPVTILGPFYIGSDRYFDGGFWMAHLVSVFINLFFCVVSYISIEIDQTSLSVSSFGLFGKKTETIYFAEISAVDKKYPLILVDKNGREVIVNWVSLSGTDKQKLFDIFNEYPAIDDNVE